jgi:dethiobiotin synthetase
MRGVFITGSDTGVGKTYVGARLAARLVGRGLRVRPRKPVESGCPRVDGLLQPQDAAAYHDAVSGAEPLQRICPYRFEAALSPERAAALAGVRLLLDDLRTACMKDVGAEDFLLVEGAGGFCSPIASDGLNTDLAVALGLPVLLVSADRLGAIHQVLVTAEAIARRGLELAGVVLNRLAPAQDPLLDNVADLARWLGREVILVAYQGGVGVNDGLGGAMAGLIDRLAVPRRQAGGDYGS